MALAVAAAAVVMGLPTLRGTFVGGDDYRLVLNHVLVSRPSLEHAIELFRIVHRDLYQPLPLLSFSAEFAAAKALGLFEGGVDAGAWLFHLNNVLLHAVNAVLVFLLIRQLARPQQFSGTTEDAAAIDLNKRHDGSDVAALIAALVFAVHPLQVEVVAWINGRMMLLSTLFALATLLALCRWMRARSALWTGMVLFFTVCCAISKIRVELPLLMLLVPLAWRRRPCRGYWMIWLANAAITAGFTWINIEATDEAGMFEGAVKNLRGPGIARGLISLAWYFEHYAWPRGLASWYPAPGDVAWGSAQTLRAMLVVVPLLGAAAWCCWKWRGAAWGWAWFFAAIAATLQVVPTRNALAADRYMYLPIVGLAWTTGVMVMALNRRLMNRTRHAPPARAVAGTGGCLIVVAAIAQSWHVASFYDNPVVKSRRIADLFPDALHVWERVGWALYNEGRYADAIEAARRELRHVDAFVRSEGHELIGASLVKLGRFDEALAALHEALRLAPDRGSPNYRLGWAHEEMGRVEDALPHYEKAVAIAPLKNPWIVHLAQVYRQLGRDADARRLYEQALRNNPYEVPAILGLADLEITTDTPSSLASAEIRLGGLLQWYGDDPAAWANLGVIRARTGRVAEAAEAYGKALQFDPAHATAAVNLGQLYESAGDSASAERAYTLAAGSGNLTLEQAVLIHNFYLREGRPMMALNMWIRVFGSPAGNADARPYYYLAESLAAELPYTLYCENPNIVCDPGVPFGLGGAPTESHRLIDQVTLAYIDLVKDRASGAAQRTDRLCEQLSDANDGPAAREQFLLAMGIAASKLPESPWPYCLAARVQLCGPEPRGAAPFLEQCASRCREGECQAYLFRVRAAFEKL